MSFSSEQKTEIITQSYKSACCRRALLHGIIFTKAKVQNNEIVLALESNESASFFGKLCFEFFGKTPNISTSSSGGRRRILSFFSPACERYISEIESNDSKNFIQKCQYCKMNFLKGIFLACGRVSDPEKQYNLEFAPSERIEKLDVFLNSIGISLKHIRRRNEEILYSKHSGVVEDFFAAAGMNTTAFDLMNSKIENEIRNNVNRVRNCETNNILKAVSSSMKQIAAIEELERANLLSTLPEELEVTARLRLNHKDLSLAQLSSISVPPISKSGISHRLNKIIDISSRLLSKNK